jgi:predicted MPP superfamily phosphohydrolase
MGWRKIIISILLLALFLLIYNYIQISKVYINKVRIPTKKFNKDMKITQISDYHSNKYINKNKLIKEIIEFSPDIIFLTGDIIDFKTIDIQPTLDFMKEIVETTPNVYFVSGNHEIRSVFYKEFLKGLESLGVIVLDNEKDIINIEDENLNLAGISFYASKEDYNKVMDNIDTNNYTILLSHSPNRPISYLSGKEDLILSGHTHGGQVRLPLIGAIVAPGQGYFPKYDKGLFQIGETTLYIDSGLGNSVYPIRFLNRVQISNITIENDR